MIETYVAIQGVCAWPNLQQLEDGTLMATIFNQPCHGVWEGDLECWASKDEGRTWRFRSRPTSHEPGTNRMNCAVGWAPNGDMLILCSGWTNRGAVGERKTDGRRKKLPVCICRSSDGARTWQVEHNFPDPPPTELGKDDFFVPFGNIATAHDGSLCVSAYLKKGLERACYFLRSRDDGRIWGEPVVLNPEGNETAVLHLGGEQWLASSRNNHKGKNVIIELLSSEDDGRTWEYRLPVTLANQVTSHLMRLADGRILLSYGNRNWGRFGVDVRFSEDEGHTWGAPIHIADAPQPDCGYPSSVQLPDGKLVTAYYTKLSHDYHYEMRVARWNPTDFVTSGLPAQS